MTRIYFADTEALKNADVYKKYYNLLSESRKAKADRYFFEKDKILSVAVGALVDIGLREYGLSEREMTIKANEYGKPYFESRSDIYFNASHSENKAMVCFSDFEVGCDIEKIKTVDKALAERFFCESEAKLACENDMFFRLWTLKESYIKAKGKGLAIPLSSFEIVFEDEKPRIKDGSEYSLYEISSFDGFKSSLCIKAPLDDVKTRLIEFTNEK